MLKDGCLVNQDDKNIWNPVKDNRIWTLPTPIGYMECNEGVLQVNTNSFGEMIRDSEKNGHIDVLIAPKISPIPDNQEWEILETHPNGYFRVRHYSSCFLLTAQTGGNMTLEEQGNIEIYTCKIENLWQPIFSAFGSGRN